MWRLTPVALAAALVLAAPGSASAVPVPPPDVLDECAESGDCDPTMTVFVLDPNGMITDIYTCTLESEHTIHYTGIFVIGHSIFVVQIGWTVCWYGDECGGYIEVAGSVTVGPS